MKKTRIGFIGLGMMGKYMAKDAGIFNEVVKSQKVNHVLAKPVLDFLQVMAKKYGEEDSMYIFEHFLLKNKN